ncbi:MAG: 4-(cytidine 5'-diphospho)-2-C-methyl-D-erythritol kinase, partial [Cyclobacteriaceae bacterium]
GGSSDGAFTLKLLNNIFKLELGTNQLAEYALLLGSDCSFFIYDKPMLGSGRGEHLESIDLTLAGKHIVVIKPDVNVSTSEAYQEIKPKESGPSLRNILEKSNDNHWQAIITNDFETSVFSRYPAIEKIKNTLLAAGAQYASMSGSGSAVFGLFDSAVDLRNEFKGMTYWSGLL